MSGASVELNLFRMDAENPSHLSNPTNPSKSQLQRLLQHRNTTRGVHISLSQINPALLKTVIESGTANGTGEPKSLENGGFMKHEMVFRPMSVPSTPKTPNQNFIPALPLFNPAALRASSESLPETPSAPITIMYNGTVTVFEIPRDKAEMIMKLAEEGNLKPVQTVDLKVSIPLPSSDEHRLFEKLNGDLPIARKKSLQRFLEKRKERLTMVSPYACFNASDSVVEKKFE